MKRSPYKNSSPKTSRLTGTIRIHFRGFGFVIPDEKKNNPVDIFIPKRFTADAVDGDSVEVEIAPTSFSPKGPEGKVVKILKRGRSHVGGTITYVGKKEMYAFVPLLGDEPLMRILPYKERKLQVGDRITIQVLDWGSRRRGVESRGEVAAYIGSILDASLDNRAALQEFELTERFPDEAIKEAQNFGTSVPQKEIRKRVDLRELECITIDPETAKDFDDAISLKQDRKGNYHLGVHIADVSHYVAAGSALDTEAKRRCNSVYFPGFVLPMLPHELSSHLCSLKPNVNRLAISVLMILSKEGDLLEYEICRSVIKSQKRFSYEEAFEVLEGRKKSPFLKQLKIMASLCHALKKKRAARGCVEFALPDLSLKLDSRGEVESVTIVNYDISHQMIEEMMLLANEVVATHLSKEGKPVAYRVHEEPKPENLRDFAQTATLFGFPLPSKPTGEELQNLFDEARGTPFGEFLATAFIKSMKLASYSTQNIGHYGLGLEFYTHFTSPIRRYIDLVIHRLLFEKSDPQASYEDIALSCSEKERHAAKAEQSVIKLKKLRYLLAEQKKGRKVYQGAVVAVKPHGYLFELKEILFEGFVSHPYIKFKVGDPLTIELIEIDLVARETHWKLSLSTKPKNQQAKKRKKP